MGVQAGGRRGGVLMHFEEILDQAIAMLQRRGRVTYRALKRQFNLDDAFLEDLTVELIKGQRLARDEDGEVLVWVGDAAPPVAPAPTPPPAAVPVPLAYTPPYLVEKILTTRSAMEGERKQVTVLFADLKGSTELIRDLDPEAAQKLLDPALKRMMDAVHRFEGTVNQVLGDGIMLVETGELAGETGAYRLVQPLQSIQVPATVQAVLAARIDRLPPEAKRLLQTAAVIGTEVPYPLLAAIADLPNTDLHRHLTHLQAAEFLYETRLFPESEYTFKHALTHEVAYGSLLHERRRVLQARIVEALEALAGDRVAEQVERLAHHALRGEVWDKALAYCRQAGEKAMTQSAYREAVEYFEQALKALPHLPEQRATREQAIDLRLALRSALLPSGDPGRILETCARPRPSRRPSTTHVGWDRSLSFWPSISTSGARMTQCMPLPSVPSHLPRPAGRSSCTRWRTSTSARVYEAQGDYRQAIDCLRQTVAFLDGAQRHERFGQVILPAVSARAFSLCAMPSWARSLRAVSSGKKGSALPRRSRTPRASCLPIGGLVCWPSAKVTCTGAPHARTGYGHLSGRGPPNSFPLDGCGLGCSVHPGRARRRRHAAAHAGNGTGNGDGNSRLSGAL